MTDWQVIYEETVRLWEKKKSKSHNEKKTDSRKASTEDVNKSEEELKRLAKISATYFIKNELANKLFKKSKFSSLSDAQKDRVKTKMKEKTQETRLKKISDKMTKEKSYKQKEKQERIKAKKTKDKMEKKEHLKKAKEYGEKADAIRDGLEGKKD